MINVVVHLLAEPTCESICMFMINVVLHSWSWNMLWSFDPIK